MTTPQPPINPPAEPAYGPQTVGQPGYPQQPVGQPGYPQPPMGQPGFPQPPMGQPGFPPMAEPKRKSSAKRALIYVVGLVVLVAVGMGVTQFLNRSKPSTAKVGECLSGSKAEDLKQIKCDDPKATYKIVGKIDSITEAAFQTRQDPCAAYPTADTGYWEGEQGKVGYALCLEPL